jgi:hypothetical protein
LLFSVPESSFDDVSLLLLRADPNLVICVIPLQFHDFFLFLLFVYVLFFDTLVPQNEVQ